MTGHSGHGDTSRPWRKKEVATTTIKAKDPKAVKKYHGDKRKPRRLTMQEVKK